MEYIVFAGNEAARLNHAVAREEFADDTLVNTNHTPENGNCTSVFRNYKWGMMTS